MYQPGACFLALGNLADIRKAIAPIQATYVIGIRYARLNAHRSRALTQNSTGMAFARFSPHFPRDLEHDFGICVGLLFNLWRTT